MILDGRTFQTGKAVQADVCIVGAGPAGIALAARLRDRGMHVCVLESGGTRRSLRSQLLLGGESVGYPYPRLVLAGVSAFGGSSHHWGPYWHARPLDGLDFEQREGVRASGWPFTRRELEQDYAEAERFLGLRPFDFAASTRETDAAALIPLREGRFVTGELQHGSPSFAHQYDALGAATDVDVILGAHVAELLPDPKVSGRIAGARAVLGSGRELTVKARVTVLAAGGLGNARLLLLGNADAPDGIGNRHDLVGRYFTEHVALRSGVVVPRGRSLLECADLFGISERDGARSLRFLAPSEDVLRAEGLLNTYFILDARPQAFTAAGVRATSTFARALRSQPITTELPARFGRAAAAVPALGRAALAARGEPDVLVVRVQAEQAPNRESRVTLSRKTNRFGVRLARLDWQLLPQDRSSIRRAQELLDAELRAAGLGHLDEMLGDERPEATMAGLYHQLGTTRMSDDPAEGVVDPSGRVHDVEGLYVTGGSVFPTVGAANPTLTVVALALRLGRELERVLSSP